MFNPTLCDLPGEREVIAAFGGYKNNLIIPENCFSFEENLSSDFYPAISPRSKRGYFNIFGDDLNSLFSKEKIVYVKGNRLFYGGEEVKGLNLKPTNEKRQFVSMGARLLIFPDKIYVNTKNLEDFGSLESEFTTSGSVSLSMCKSDGDLYEGYTVSSAEPQKPNNADLWLDTSQSPHILKQYSSNTGTWFEIFETYIKISSGNIGKGFNIDDGVVIKGLESYGIENAHIIRDKGQDFVVVSGIIDNAVTLTSPVTLSRKLPQMDFVCENGNRLWGCNSKTNEIYASKLGSPENFNCFMGISTDSYAASLGSDGDFTGAVSFRGYILFFKENCVHKIFGSNPPYTITTSYIRGVQKGSSASLVILNETLYYKSPTGVCAYEGGVPLTVSADLGNDYFTNAVGGRCKNKYYICMTDKFGERVLFSYDEEKNIWHREGKGDFIAFCENNSNLYFIENKMGENRLGLMDSSNKYGNFTGELKGLTLEDDFKFTAISGLWGLNDSFYKYYKSIVIRAKGSKNSLLKIYFEYNSSGKFVKEGEFKFKETGSVLIPVITPRCDNLRIKFEGTGDIKIFSVSRKKERGSELNV